MADWWNEDAPTLGDHWRDGRQPDGDAGDWWMRRSAPGVALNASTDASGQIHETDASGTIKEIQAE